MPVTNVSQDPQALTMTVVADFPVSVRRLWDAYVDPRQIEKFWGPVEWPATFTRHDVYPGGESHYYMTGPDGERSGGWFEYLAVDEGRSFEVLDGFAREDGTRDPESPVMRMVFEFEETSTETGTGSRLINTTYFNSAEELEQILGMGMEEGLLSAMSQIDDVVADLQSFAAGRAVDTQLIGDNQARMSRVIRGPVEEVWRAHHEPELLRRWQLGPDGWTMPVCEVGTSVGDTYRFVWEKADAGKDAGNDGGERFGFTGTVLESAPPHREVTTEAMIDGDTNSGDMNGGDMNGGENTSTTNEMTLTSVEGGTLLSLLVTYPNAELRETILATGMADGMESSYARLESEVLAAL
ncbi:SRPBCC domain-containing protein [Citricoccus sp. GCM10030269]|uniref:SRPBCC family protein n=1 Tax=Citricoccus sp. GCM10030269 TaxID=3273388 RepID=UPI003622DD5F